MLRTTLFRPLKQIKQQAVPKQLRLASRFKPSGGGRKWKLYLFSFGAGALVAHQISLFELYELACNKLPSRADPVEYDKYVVNLEEKLQRLGIVKKLCADPEWKCVRAWENLSSNVLNSSMMNGTLAQPGGFAVKPMIFLNESREETLTIVHVGRKLCGYPLLIHGGILATIFDENLKRCSLLQFKNEHKDTPIDYANEESYSHIHAKDLTLQYKFPTLGDNFIVIRAKCEKFNESDNSVLVKGVIKSPKGRTLVEGTSSFILPPSTRHVVKAKGKEEREVEKKGEEKNKAGWFWK